MKFDKAAARRFTMRAGVLAGALLFLPDLASELFARKQNVLQNPLKRKQVSELFEQGKRLEALPLAEELVKADPRDDQMMVILAACLVDHAATLTDQDAAGKERLRARELLNAAWNLGNTSTLARNLSDLLKRLPESGAVKFSDNAQADQAIRAGEAAFSRRDYEEARKRYMEALHWEPRSYSATLFIGNSYDRQNQAEKAAEWYGRAVGLNPDIETAYRYYADLLAKQGDMKKARTMLIRAAVAEPYNRIVWRELRAWAKLNHTDIREIYVSVPPESQLGAAANGAGDFSTAWVSYRKARENWRDNGGFAKRYPGEKAYRHSLLEEAEALQAAGDAAQEILRTDAVSAARLAGDPSAALLLKLCRADMIAPYVLFSLGDEGISHDYSAYRLKSREKLERYLDEFVVPQPN
jgi:tetratricopeptide (TPR) repeat protein